MKKKEPDFPFSQKKIFDWYSKKIDEALNKVCAKVNIDLSEEEERKRVMIELINLTDYSVYIDGKKVGEIIQNLPGFDNGTISGSVEYNWKISPEELAKIAKKTNGEK